MNLLDRLHHLNTIFLGKKDLTDLPPFAPPLPDEPKNGKRNPSFSVLARLLGITPTTIFREIKNPNPTRTARLFTNLDNRIDRLCEWLPLYKSSNMPTMPASLILPPTPFACLNFNEIIKLNVGVCQSDLENPDLVSENSVAGISLFQDINQARVDFFQTLQQYTISYDLDDVSLADLYCISLQVQNPKNPEQSTNYYAWVLPKILSNQQYFLAVKGEPALFNEPIIGTLTQSRLALFDFTYNEKGFIFGKIDPVALQQFKDNPTTDTDTDTDNADLP